MHQHCGGEGLHRYARRVAGMAVTAPVMPYMWAWGAVFLIRHDPRPAGRLRYSLGAHNRAVRKGLLSTWKEFGSAVPRCLRRSYPPSAEGSTRRAVEYLAQSPTVRAAAGAIGRAAIA